MYTVHPSFWPKLSGKKSFVAIFKVNYLFIYIEKQNRLLYSRVLFCITISLLLSGVTFKKKHISINRRIKNIDTEWVLPTLISPQKVGQKVCIKHGEIQFSWIRTVVSCPLLWTCAHPLRVLSKGNFCTWSVWTIE